MTVFDRLDKLYEKPPVSIALSPPLVFFSDLHLGDGGPADDFEQNYGLFKRAFDTYKSWRKIGLGDIEELWQFRPREILRGFLFQVRLRGNHDREISAPEAAILTVGDARLLVSHGHAGDLFNDQYWKAGRFFTRYVWKGLEAIGLKDPPPSTDRHGPQRQALIQWANCRKIIHVHGHCHLLERNGFDIDCGSSVQPGIVECVELTEAGFKLIRWTNEGKKEVV